MICFNVWREPRNIESKKLFTVLSGKGERSILFHVGSKYIGLLKSWMLLFRRSKSYGSSNYHSEMSHNVFCHWHAFNILPNLKRIGRKLCLCLTKVLIRNILDEDDERPVEVWNKKIIVNSIIRVNGFQKIGHRHGFVRNQVINCSSNPRESILLQTIRHWRFVLRPVAHPEFNLIGMVWVCVKRTVAAQNLSCKLIDVE